MIEVHDVVLGDVIQVKGPTVPRDLEDKWFRVEGIEEGILHLSHPYYDKELTRPYRLYFDNP